MSNWIWMPGVAVGAAAAFSLLAAFENRWMKGFSLVVVFALSSLEIRNVVKDRSEQNELHKNELEEQRKKFQSLLDQGGSTRRTIVESHDDLMKAIARSYAKTPEEKLKRHTLKIDALRLSSDLAKFIAERAGLEPTLDTFRTTGVTSKDYQNFAVARGAFATASKVMFHDQFDARLGYIIPALEKTDRAYRQEEQLCTGVDTGTSLRGVHNCAAEIGLVAVQLDRDF